MTSFRKFLEDQQMMMFTTKPVELYHGSNTGADNSVLQNFKTNGIVPNIAQGHGQGLGFYVWSDKKSAVNHTSAIKQDSITTMSKKDGYPMIVTLSAIPDPEKWDLDYESNKKVLVNWMYDNFDKFNQILNNDDVGLSWKGDREIHTDDDKKIMARGVTAKVGTSRKAIYAHNDASIRDGQILSSIVSKLQQKDPVIVHKFEELFFANMRPAVAIKYVGSEPLKPKKIEIFKDNNWIEV
jgi:hypothetical protein